MKLIDPIDVVLPISNIKLANSIIFLLSWIDVLSSYNTFNSLILLVNSVEAFELINNFFNIVSLYCELIDELKT